MLRTGFFAASQAAAGVEFVGAVDADINNNRYNYPLDVQAGDLLVLMSVQYRYNANPTTTVNGFTLIGSQAVNASGDRYQSYASYRIATGTEGATITYGHNVLSGVMLQFRQPGGFTGVQQFPSSNFSFRAYTGTPASVTILSGNKTPPVIALAHQWADNGTGFTTENPLFQYRESTPAGSGHGASWRMSLYDKGGDLPVNHLINVPNPGYAGAFLGGFLLPT